MEKKEFKLPSPKTAKERIEWLRRNDSKFSEEEKIIDEVKKNLKPK